jgi:hypothetical protein
VVWRGWRRMLRRCTRTPWGADDKLLRVAAILCGSLSLASRGRPVPYHWRIEGDHFLSNEA